MMAIALPSMRSAKHGPGIVVTGTAPPIPTRAVRAVYHAIAPGSGTLAGLYRTDASVAASFTRLVWNIGNAGEYLRLGLFISCLGAGAHMTRRVS